MYRRTLMMTDFCLSPTEYVRNAGILIEEGMIVAVGGESGFMMDSDVRVCRHPGTYALPGFVDTHIHGGNGFDSTMASATLDRFGEMSRALSAHGVTSFVPTVISAPIPQMADSLRTLAGLISGHHHEGAEPVAIHVEGPFIAKGKRGSQRAQDILPIDLGIARELIAAGKGHIKIWTFAPELAHAEQLIELLCEHHIIPSMGHTDASEHEIFRAIDAGASRCTHLFNGVPALHQRNISLAAVALTDDRITTEIILDGTHVHPRMVELTCRAKPKDRIVGVSDSVAGAGLSDGVYQLGMSQINVRNGVSHTEEGVLAGSTQSLETGWNRLARYNGITQTDAAACFTLNAALSIGLHDRGLLSPGTRADIAFFDQKTNACKLTIVRGKVVYAADPDFMW